MIRSFDPPKKTAFVGSFAFVFFGHLWYKARRYVLSLEPGFYRITMS